MQHHGSFSRIGTGCPSSGRTSMYEEEQFNANSFRALFRPRKSLGFMMPALAKSDQPSRAVALETLCRSVYLGRELLVPPLVCDLICHIEHTGIDCPLLYYRTGDLTNRPNYSSMFETLLDNGPHSFDCRSASLLARKMLKAVEKPFLDQDSQTQLTKAIDGWDRGAVQNLVNTVKSILSTSPMSRCYKDTLSLICVHLSHVHLASQSEKTDIGHLVESFTSVLRVKDRILKFLIANAESIFDPIDFKMVTTRQSLNDDEEIVDVGFLQNELQRKESLLTMLIADVSRESDKDKEEMLWTMQREITQIKRKLKKANRSQKAMPQTKKNTEIDYRSVSPVTTDRQPPPPTAVEASGPKEPKEDDQVDASTKLSDSKSILLGRQMLSTLKAIRDSICEELQAVRELERKVDVRHDFHQHIPIENPEELSSRLAQIVIENDNLQAQIEAVKEQIDREQRAIDHCSAELEWQKRQNAQLCKYSPVEVE